MTGQKLFITYLTVLLVIFKNHFTVILPSHVYLIFEENNFGK